MDAELDRTVRARIYDHFHRTGAAPTHEALAESTGITPSEVTASLRRLAAAHALALAPGSENIWMAHPFSSCPTAFPVSTPTILYWANCAWDAVSIPSMLRVDATVRARCAAAGDTMDLEFRDGELTSGSALVHFAVPPRRFWDNVGFT